MSAFGDIAVRISSLPEFNVDRILKFASNELDRDEDRPLAVQTYVALHHEAEHAAATITWLRAEVEADWRDQDVGWRDQDVVVRLRLSTS